MNIYGLVEFNFFESFWIVVVVNRNDDLIKNYVKIFFYMDVKYIEIILIRK